MPQLYMQQGKDVKPGEVASVVMENNNQRENKSLRCTSLMQLEVVRPMADWQPGIKTLTRLLGVVAGPVSSCTSEFIEGGLRDV
jgi:hypothetical protein